MQKERRFHLLWQPSGSQGKSHNVASKTKAFLSSSVWPRREYTWTLNWKQSLLICFESYQGIPYSHTGRVDSENV